MRTKSLTILLISLMVAAALPLVTSAGTAPMFHLNDNWDGKISAYAKPPGAGGGSGSVAQEVDWGVARVNGGPGSGAGIVVAILDTGIDTTHEDLQGISFTCFSGITRADYADCTNRNVADDDGHGTHVAGTIAAVDNAIDSVGLAQGVSIISGKVLGKRGGSWDDLSWAIHHATDMGADIISMSLGGDLSSSPSTQTLVNDAVAYAVNAGVAVVVAAGNEGDCTTSTYQHSWPAESPGAFTVGATGLTDASGSWATTWTGAENDVMPCFSNDMLPGVVDVSAPGVYITASKRGGGVTDLSGTSMATPHVSAAIAVLMAGGMTSAQAMNFLVNNAIDMGYSSTLQGAGLIQL